ncbi:hypothetical protein TIFTF001_030863 [Ficus carica]|uniref:Uncharacterized protein n=1 Tax=Ficus carica TaxID=3494 RepID=A0AA88J4C5_FICCA|nr:hypothetical protein TIFTF001_030863 [Ficus carica]
MESEERKRNGLGSVGVAGADAECWRGHQIWREEQTQIRVGVGVTGRRRAVLEGGGAATRPSSESGGGPNPVPGGGVARPASSRLDVGDRFVGAVGRGKER